MITVKVSKEIESVCPHFVGACVEAQVLNTNFCQPLWDEINALGEQFRKDLTTESLKHLPSIEATRHIYRLCGKDPSRYRPASEALIRRMLQGKQLYQIDTLVDLINLASIAYGYSIGGFDADKFEGTPTSDNERTKIDLHTTHLVVLINGYDGNEQRVSDNATFIQGLLRKYCESDGGSFYLYR